MSDLVPDRPRPSRGQHVPLVVPQLRDDRIEVSLRPGIAASGTVTRDFEELDEAHELLVLPPFFAAEHGDGDLAELLAAAGASDQPRVVAAAFAGRAGELEIRTGDGLVLPEPVKAEPGFGPEYQAKK